MTDALLRRPKEILLAPLARRAPRRLHPTAITLIGVVPGLGAAFAAAAGNEVLAVALWLLNRLFDGLDGTLARVRGCQSDLGAYLDILMDFVVYAAVPIGLAVHLDTRAGWIAAAVLLAAFYVNTISWAYLSALMERRRRERTDELTSVTMPGGLIEGAETIAFYVVMLALPAATVGLFWTLAACVAVTIGQRLLWALRNL